MREVSPPIQAASEVALAHGHAPDRCDVLQDGNTLVVRLSETLVARVVQDRDGPRQGTEWFTRENAVALHLASQGAPVIPLHPDIPPGPHFHRGYPINFWRFVVRVEGEPPPVEVGATLFRCHQVLRGFPGSLPHLGIVEESLALLGRLEMEGKFDRPAASVLRRHLERGLEQLMSLPAQPLHGDAHGGNLMLTTEGLLWTDWEDTFLGPVEWDLASITWNQRVLEADDDAADHVLRGYREAGGKVDASALDLCMTARAAVMSTWYPVLYPEPSAERREKLRLRLAWLSARS